ncbi:MAG TPA: HemK/PrmC family methyltransferase [Actinomycetota bacterium]|nr:HemK/PrmC family methyltransferase [Actinomycetota bacterium]
MTEPTTAGDLIDEAVQRLKRSPAIEHWPSDRERWDAEQVMSFVLGLDDEAPYLDEPIDGRRRRRFRELVRRRAGGEPLAQIFGYTRFCGLKLTVTPGIFVPRQSTEFMVDQALRRLRGRQRPVAVDLATGGGPVALAVAHALRRAEVHGTDVSEEAVGVARRNARTLRLANVSFRRGDLYAPLPRRLAGVVDVVTIHPPYVPRSDVETLPLEIRGFEPEHTLTDYSDHGLGIAERAAVDGRAWLRPGGWILMEVSPDRARAVRALVVRAGYRDVRSTIGPPQVTRVVVGRAP